MKQGLYIICAAGSKADVLAKIKNIDAADAFLYEGENDLPAFADAVQAKNIAFMVMDSPQNAVKIKADGVQVAYSKDIKKIRQSLGDLALGVVCSTRDEAMRAGEAGADYIAFDGENAVELAQWWIDLFNIPCISLNGTCSEADFEVKRI